MEDTHEKEIDLDLSSLTLKGWASKKLQVRKNVHQDDIHGLLLLDNCFVSGSKDGNIMAWNFDGSRKRTVWENESINYCEWITAMARAPGSNVWMTATRNGYVDVWNEKGENLVGLGVCVPPQSKSKCKERNTTRANCISICDGDSKDSITCHIGWARQFTTYHINLNTKTVRTDAIPACVTSENDWVYCVDTLRPNAKLVVTGERLEMWEYDTTSRRWKMGRSFIPQLGGRVRPYISHIKQLQGNPSLYGVAVFDGSVRVIDVEQGKQIWKRTEHKHRVWTVENITQHIFSSCADDGFVKVWDLRNSQRSVCTLPKHIGRVSSTLKLHDDHTLVTATCPNDLRATRQRAEFNFWDIRYV